MTGIGLTPVFRFQRNGLEGLYAEADIGLHLLSATSVSDKRLSTRAQFGDHVGLGYRFGARGAWGVAYRYQHRPMPTSRSPAMVSISTRPGSSTISEKTAVSGKQ